MTGYNSETLADAAVMMAGLQQFLVDAADTNNYRVSVFEIQVDTDDVSLVFRVRAGEVVLDA
jgi:hypothetical protein